jgi:DNA-binding MarR family transcriptional regulator
VSIPAIGQDFRGLEGNSGYLLRQAWHLFRAAMEAALRPHGISSAQYAVLSVLARTPGASSADLARAGNTTAQAMNGLVVALERNHLIERSPHPTHGRILQVTLTPEGRRRLEEARQAVGDLEREMEHGFDPDEIRLIKRWLVTTAQRSHQSTHPHPH